MSDLSTSPPKNNLFEKVAAAVTSADADLMGEEGLHSWLSLAPIHSASYPMNPHKATTEKTEKIADAAASLSTDQTVAPAPKERTSSISSAGSSTSSGFIKLRFLKLSPVHGGGEPGVSDYVEWEEEE